MNNNYEKIRAACIKANPKLLEVGLGTRFLYRHQGQAKLEEHLIVTERNGYWVTDDNRIWDKEQFHLILGLEILGHPIQLSDVLMAIHKANRFIFIGVTGRVYQDNIGDLIGLDIFFDLSKSVEQQSPETLQFIADLL